MLTLGGPKHTITTCTHCHASHHHIRPLCLENACARADVQHCNVHPSPAAATCHTLTTCPPCLPQEVENAYVRAEAQRLEHHSGLLSDVLNISSVVTDAGSAMVDDSFLKCFTSMPPDPWNWNIYLMPAWLLGLVFRWALLWWWCGWWCGWWWCGWWWWW